MNMRVLLLALLAGSAMSTAAFAAVDASGRDQGHPSSRSEIADRCSTLESQYSAAVGAHRNAPKLARADGLFSMGTSNCQDNEPTLGAYRLEHALRDIGVKPAA